MEQKALVRGWMRLARNDYIASEALIKKFDQRFMEISLSLLRQSAEKALKGYLAFIGVCNSEDFCELEDLLRLCEWNDPAFDSIAAECRELALHTLRRYIPRCVFLLRNMKRNQQ